LAFAQHAAKKAIAFSEVAVHFLAVAIQAAQIIMTQREAVGSQKALD
jgi:hypothetical protein